MISDLLLGWALAQLFKKPAAAPSSPLPSSPLPSSPPSSSVPSSPASAPAPRALPTPGETVPAPVFPAAVPVSPAPKTTPAGSQQPPAGFKRAVEVWIVRPEQVAAARSSDPKAQALAVRLLESQFPRGWQGAARATPAEAAEAKALLSQWHDGGVVFSGGTTPATIRAFRMTKHPAQVLDTTATPAPVAPPIQRPATAPAAAPTPVGPVPAAAAPAPVQAPATAPAAPSSAPSSGPLVTTVQKGEGLAQVARRLGQPATATSAKALRAANIPQGPDARWTALPDGNLKRAGRAGGLQPGDRLFVPASWGPLDAARL